MVAMHQALEAEKRGAGESLPTRIGSGYASAPRLNPRSSRRKRLRGRRVSRRFAGTGPIEDRLAAAAVAQRTMFALGVAVQG
jgi:hypothetical protein